MRSNKFNISWQSSRVKARMIKDVELKIKFVMEYYKINFTIQDKLRVLNWLKMTRVGYKTNREIFDDFISEVSQSEPTEEDNKNDFSDFSVEDILRVQKDLNKRKYNFQFNKTPKDHIDFMEKIDNYLKGKK